ncbi:MAG: SIS domain-containing protein [Ruminococcaceae bacterium]|nr:SIS domain-containing protein [Oscillospiraceae bacterium]
MTANQILSDLLGRYPALAACRTEIEAAHALLRDTFSADGKLLIAGNGGSASDANHIVGELMKGFLKKRPVAHEFAKRLEKNDPVRGEKLKNSLQGALPAIALSVHGSLLTAFMNDADPDAVFAQQVYGYGKKGDVLLCISTSGNSENLVLAALTAAAKEMRVLLLTGESGGRLAPLSDLAIRVPATDTHVIQELHLPIYHALCGMLESDFFEV